MVAGRCARRGRSPAVREPGVRARVSQALLVAAIAGACSPMAYVRQADEDVDAVLGDADRTALADREQWIRQPETRAEPESAEGAAAADDSGAADAAQAAPAGRAARLEITLSSALRSAYTTGREYLTRREGLYISGLGLTLTRFRFGPQVDAAVTSVWGESDGGPSNTTLGADVGVSQVLGTGGTFSLRSGLSTTRTSGPHGADPDKGRVWSSNIDFALNQPLLRGAGYDVAWESLTQAERDILYEVRSFELFRQDYAISIVAEYFGLISQRRQLANTRSSYEDALYDRKKSEALRQVDRITDEGLIQTRRREVDARNALLVAETDYQFALDAFRIRLGLGEADEVIVGEEDAPFERVRLDADSAVEVALANRLDLITAREQVEDTERRLAISRNGLLPDVDLGLGYGLGRSDGSFAGATPPDRWAASASLRVEIPLQRLPERNSYRAALIGYDQAQRALELTLANTERDVRDSLRSLDQLEEQIALAEQQIRQDERAVALTQIRYEAGEIDARDLLESRQSLVDSQNALIQVQLSHFIARLRLYRDLGLLFIDENGSWRA